MVERYHLVAALLAVLLGAALAAVDRLVPAWPTRRTLGLAGLVGAVVGGWGSVRVVPWLLAAAVASLWPDDERETHPLGPSAVAATVASLVGVWSAVPDTEAPLVAGGVLAPLAVVWLLGGRVVGRAGTAALVVAVLGATWVGSAGWGAALATGCAVGMVAIAPLVLGWSSRPLTPRRQRVGWSMLIVAHLLVALVLPRVLMRREVGVAAGLAVAALGLSAGLAALVRRSQARTVHGVGAAEPPR